MITLNNISKSYASATGRMIALHNIQLQIERGDIVGIVGKSGAGKSTLIRCINLLERPDTGNIWIDGQEITALSAPDLRLARRHIGMIFQHFNLLSARTVYDNIALPLELARTPQKIIAKTIAPLLELTGLQDRQNYYPAQLSGGQKQRVAIARALTTRPAILLSDEATSALDPETTQTILQLLKQIRHEFNVTILMITHDMAAVKYCCDRIGILDKGELVEENEIGEFFAHPRTDIAKNFITASLIQALPQAIHDYVQPEASANTHPVLRLWFFGGSATEPIMAQLINQFNLRINILQANLEYIKKHAMGIMILAIDGEKHNQDASIQHLQSIGIHVEIIGYVPNNIIPFI